jgi:hypothetical protein
LPRLRAIVDELQNWPGPVISSHKSAKQFFHKISFLAELGFNIDDPGISEISEKIIKGISGDGIIKMPVNIPVSYGGSGTGQCGWALCDAPINLYALSKLGLKNDKRINSGVDKLTGLARDNGWPCAVSEELGSWRGPGRRDDPCPYATLVMLRLLSQFEDYHDTPQVKSGIDCLCGLWKNSLKSHPYIFYMGNDFRKLKAPLIWYDIIHVLDVLSRFEYSRNRPEVKQMIDVVVKKMDTSGSFTPESAWQEFKEWDFGQKKVPSAFLTFLIYRIFKRLDLPLPV